MLFVRRCPVCLRDGEAPCAQCRRQFVPAAVAVPPKGCDELTALVEYVGAGRELVRSTKYHNHRDAIRWVATQLADRMGAVAPGTVVTWVPASRQTRRRNGYDHAEILAASLARRLRAPKRRLLARAPASPEQVGRGARERRRGVQIRAVGAVPDHVIVVDDVVTTGASLTSAAGALRRRGAGSVHAVVIAETPHRAHVA